MKSGKIPKGTWGNVDTESISILFLILISILTFNDFSFFKKNIFSFAFLFEL